jgi:predicted nucleic-acid-binding protein
MATGLSYLQAQAYGQNDHILSEMPQNFKNLAKCGKIFKISQTCIICTAYFHPIGFFFKQSSN